MFRRVAACAGLFVVSALLVAQRAEPASAQNKDKKDNTDALQKQLKAAQQDLVQAAKIVAGLRQDVAELKAANNRLEALLKKERADDKKDANKKDPDDQVIKDLRTTIDGFRGAGLVHVVVLKAKSGTKPADAQVLIDDAYAQLTKIKGVRSLWAGKPAAKASPDAATDYTVALALLFDDAAGVRSYLNDPAHKKFADKHLKNWEAPAVYDFEPRKPKP